VKPSSPLDVLTPSRLKLHSSDTVYSPGYNCGVTRARQIVTIHDLIHLDDPGQKSNAKDLYYERLVKPAIRRAGLVLTVSTATQTRAAEWINDASVDVRVVGNGSSAAFSEDGPRVSMEKTTFLYVGNLRSHKNVGILMSALKQRADYRLILVTPDSQDVQLLAQQYGVLNQIEVRSGLSDEQLAVLYRSVTATLMPSLFEGFGLPALESFLCGTPTIYWAGCESIAEISAGNGIAVTSSDSVDEWVDALDAASQPAVALVRDAPESWQRRYNWESVAGAVGQALAG